MICTLYREDIICVCVYYIAYIPVHLNVFRVSDKYIVRIADFGLSRDVYTKDYYRRDEANGIALPIKWLALESLRSGIFSSQSDVVCA